MEAQPLVFLEFAALFSRFLAVFGVASLIVISKRLACAAGAGKLRPCGRDLRGRPAPSESLGPFHRPVKNPKNDDGVSLMDVGNHVWQTGEDQLARSFHATRPPHTGILHERLDASSDLKHCINRRLGVVPADISFDRFEILASGARPL
jgi:hypothetical protein